MRKKIVALTTVALLSSTFGTSVFANSHQVQKGDTLTHIAKKYNTSIAQLKSLNNLKSDMIYLNQIIKVAEATPVITPAPSSTAVKPSIVPPTAAPTTSNYTVVKGDTLSKIAAKHSISLTDLMTWNKLEHYIIFPGQKLKISDKATTINSKPEKTTKPKETNNSSSYIVQQGDTLSRISSKVGMTVSELKKVNQLSSDLIFIGQKLKVVDGKSVSEKEVVVVVETPPAKEETVLEDVTLPSDSIEEFHKPMNPVGLVQQLTAWVGSPYAWGGTTTDGGFDCSGFIYFAFHEMGMPLDRLSTEGYYSRSYYIVSPQIGDLVFFENTYKPGISHMGIYLGNNEFIHSSTNEGVIISTLDEAYYQERFDGFKRFY